MKSIDCVTVKGFERSGPETVKVVLECSGECFDQVYPKRLSASYRIRPKIFYEHSDGEPEVLKKVRYSYVENPVRGRDKSLIRVAREETSDSLTSKEVDDKIDKLNERFKGYEIE